MQNHKHLKVLTFSFDDGITQDRKLVELFNCYGLKCTFNINSGLLGKTGTVKVDRQIVQHNKIDPQEVASLYSGHEVAVHTVTHPRLPEIEDEETIFHQVEDDRIELERLTGQKIVGMAYPCGGINNDDRVAEIIGRRTPIQYARTITSTGSFEYPRNLLRLDPTIHAINFEQLMSLADQFISLCPDKPSLFYVWGHSYEFDVNDGWRRFEAFCKLISNRSDITYLTNSESLL